MKYLIFILSIFSVITTVSFAESYEPAAKNLQIQASDTILNPNGSITFVNPKLLMKDTGRILSVVAWGPDPEIPQTIETGSFGLCAVVGMSRVFSDVDFINDDDTPNKIELSRSGDFLGIKLKSTEDVVRLVTCSRE